MINIKKLALIAAISALGCANSASATELQTQESMREQSSSLEDIIVTSSKEPRYLKETPVRTEVITRETLEQQHTTNLADALRNIPGVMLKELHGKEGIGVWMQGFDSNRVLVLIDGNPLPASTGSSIDVTQIMTADIERIEIIKGAASALYGTSAMGGVINVITTAPKDGTHLSAEVQGGTWQNQNLDANPFARQIARFNAAAKKSAWELQFNAQLDDSNGWKVNPQTEANQGEIGSRNTFSGNLGYQFDNGIKLSLLPRYYQEDLLNVTDNFVPGVGNQPLDKVELTDSYQVGAVIQSEQNWKLRLNAEEFNNESRQDVQISNYIDQKRLTDINQYLAAFDYQLDLNNHHLTMGVEVNQQSLNVRQYKEADGWITEVDNQSAQSQEWFIQDSWFATANLEVLPGVRLHHDADFGTHISPMVSALWAIEHSELGRFNIRASVGNGYRVPNLKERYYIFDHSHLGYMVLGNPDLQPESSISYQLGTDWYFADQGSLQLHLFYNNARDLIETAYSAADSTTQNLAVYRYQNFEKVTTRGLELQLQRQLRPWLKLNASYTWLKAIDETTGNYLVKRPQHEAKFGITADLSKQLNIATYWRYESEQFIDADNQQISPDYSVLDVKLNHHLNDQWSWYAGINNLTDIQRRFDGTDYRPEEGRYLYAGLKWQYSAN
ncbi:TonB-dependent receptor [Thiomicrorhabdus sp. 6S2-11]|uniref:TonB-dependent receptor n=1 Tax=Thiomicrorhabdus marina TaxID=2818442 RepID=A0ABS3Q463_9GAMM|nr:TonB-dependent receptor [Thiomicrorhabdus marina]MBO1927061.1 TonB-dependent receptor [Thiomicrorhabdus marina]